MQGLKKKKISLNRVALIGVLVLLYLLFSAGLRRQGQKLPSARNGDLLGSLLANIFLGQRFGIDHDPDSLVLIKRKVNNCSFIGYFMLDGIYFTVLGAQFYSRPLFTKQKRQLSRFRRTVCNKIVMLIINITVIDKKIESVPA